MKKIAAILFFLSVASAATPLAAQKLHIGTRLPRIEGVEWLSDRPETGDRAMVIEFFHSSNRTCVARIDECNRLAGKYSDRLNYIVVTREPEEQVAPLLFKEYQYYYIAVDFDGSVFDACGVHYVPYAIAADRRGIVRWVGNPETLTDRTIESIIK